MIGTEVGSDLSGVAVDRVTGVTQFGDATQVFLLGEILQGRPEVYGLCWKHQTLVGAKFARMGSFELGGPMAFNGTQQCAMGTPCILRLDGIGFKQENNVAVQRVPCSETSSANATAFFIETSRARIPGRVEVKFMEL
jgi:hypothetical protein